MGIMEITGNTVRTLRKNWDLGSRSAISAPVFFFKGSSFFLKGFGHFESGGHSAAVFFFKGFGALHSFHLRGLVSFFLMVFGLGPGLPFWPGPGLPAGQAQLQPLGGKTLIKKLGGNGAGGLQFFSLRVPVFLIRVLGQGRFWYISAPVFFFKGFSARPPVFFLGLLLYLSYNRVGTLEK